MRVNDDVAERHFLLNDPVQMGLDLVHFHLSPLRLTVSLLPSPPLCLRENVLEQPLSTQLCHEKLRNKSE
jgi:hypothetical protein